MCFTTVRTPCKEFWEGSKTKGLYRLYVGFVSINQLPRRKAEEQGFRRVVMIGLNRETSGQRGVSIDGDFT